MAEKDVEFDLETGEELVAKQDDLDEDQRDDEQDDQHDDDDDEVSTKSESDDKGEEDESDREAIRERRREERRHRKQAIKEREETLRRELAARDAIINEMRTKLDGIERRNTGSEMAQLENAKKQTAQAYQFFKDQIRIATEAGNGAAVADATEKMLQAQKKFDELANFERAFKQRQSAPQPLDPRLANHAQSWMERNKWYDPTARDPDSRIAMTIDQQLAEEGWNPTTEEYWQELDSRIKKYLPHKAGRANVKDAKPRSVVTGSGRESVGSTNKGSYKLSSERVQALKDAGLWDSPKERAEAIRRFREYDKQHQG